MVLNKLFNDFIKNNKIKNNLNKSKANNYLVSKCETKGDYININITKK